LIKIKKKRIVQPTKLQTKVVVNSLMRDFLYKEL